MTLKEQILEYLEVTGDQCSFLKISNDVGVTDDYSAVRYKLLELTEDGLIIYDLATNTYKIAMDKEYTEGTDMNKQPSFLPDNGSVWIDEAARTLTPEQFRGAMRFKIGEHLHGIFKKDEIGQEVRQIAYYSCRWEEYESALLKK